MNCSLYLSAYASNLCLINDLTIFITMYIPTQYKNSDLEEIKDFIRANSFGILISMGEDKPLGTHIPLELEKGAEGKDVIVSHMARANTQWRNFKQNQEVLCIFNGPHSYVSSSWYKDEEVPTWNYIAVHVYGTIEILEEPEVLATMVRLVDKYEQHEKKPLSVANLSTKTMRQIKGVVGFKITITDIQATYKLSQGREQDHPAIIRELEQRDTGSMVIASEMNKHCPFKG